MSSPSTQKALDSALMLAQDIGLRLPSLAVTNSFDANGDPLIQVGAGTAGTASCLIRVAPNRGSQLFKDIVGNAQPVYANHVIQIAIEDISGAGAFPLGLVNQFAILGEIMKRGFKVELYKSANGTAASVTILNDATKLIATFQDLWNPLQIEQ
jgi:hypothetical protein